jgi:acyl carrier protein
MTSADPTEETLAEVITMIDGLLGDYALGWDDEITLSTTFHDDLELESVDLVTLADLLAQRYGPAVNLAEYFAEKDMDQVIAMTVGDIVAYVVQARTTGVGTEA